MSGADLNNEKPMDDPNIEKRTASGITVNLSSYLITGSLALIGAEAVLVTFVFDKRDHLAFFNGVAFTAFVSLVVSIYYGGKGIFKLIEDRSGGTWNPGTRSGAFNKQAWFTLGGAILLVVCAVLGTPKESESDKKVVNLNNAVVELRHQLESLEQGRRTDRAQIEQLQKAFSKATQSGTSRSAQGKRVVGKPK